MSAKSKTPDPFAQRRAGAVVARRAVGGQNGSELVAVEHLRVLFPLKQGIVVDRTVGHVHAVDDVSFTLHEGETLGIVGESGCGKTTLIRALVRLTAATAGVIRFRGADITRASRKQLAPIRKEMQMVFQDPQASLNPRKRVNQIIGTPLRLRGVPRSTIDAETRALLTKVGLQAEHLNRFPHEFSGGQRQRIGVARALAIDPKLILLDEPVSALDVSTRAQIMNLLRDLQRMRGLTMLFISHDLSVVAHMCRDVAVMYLGRIVELAPRAALFNTPLHPYTAALMSAIPVPDPVRERSRARTVLEGEPPDPAAIPSGCRFHTRCPSATDLCRQVDPETRLLGVDHQVACHHPLEHARL